MLQFLDKTSLNYASLLNIRKDLVSWHFIFNLSSLTNELIFEKGLVGQQYSWASSIFYFGYLIMSYPTSYMIVKFPIGTYVSTTVYVIFSMAVLLYNLVC